MSAALAKNLPHRSRENEFTDGRVLKNTFAMFVVKRRELRVACIRSTHKKALGNLHEDSMGLPIFAVFTECRAFSLAHLIATNRNEMKQYTDLDSGIFRKMNG